MSDKRLSVSARVAVTVVVRVPDSWDRSVTADQVFAQASEKAKEMVINKLVTKEGGAGTFIVQDTKVTMLMAEAEERP